MNQEIFTTLDYPNLGKVTILEGKGAAFFSAMSKTKGDTTQIVKYLMLELMLINDKPLTEEQLNNMLIRDISYFNVIINNIMSNDFQGGI